MNILNILNIMNMREHPLPATLRPANCQQAELKQGLGL